MQANGDVCCFMAISAGVIRDRCSKVSGWPLQAAIGSSVSEKSRLMGLIMLDTLKCGTTIITSDFMLLVVFPLPVSLGEVAEKSVPQWMPRMGN